MKRLLVFSLILLSHCTAMSGKPLAKVNGELILPREYQLHFQATSDHVTPEILHDPEGLMAIKKRVLNDLVEHKLLLQKVKEQKINLSPEEESLLKEDKLSGYPPQKLEQVLEEKHQDFDSWWQLQKEKRLIQKLKEALVDQNYHPNETDIKNYYKTHRKDFKIPNRVHCRHIVTNQKDKAQSVWKLINKGENFSLLAEKYSESPESENGGDLGDVEVGQGPPLFWQACFTLGTGQVSMVISSEYGFHIFKVIEKKPGRALSFEESKPEIEKLLKENISSEILTHWLEGVYNNSIITIDEKALAKLEVPLPKPVQGEPESQPIGVTP